MKPKVLIRKNAVFLSKSIRGVRHVVELSANFFVYIGMCVLAWDECSLEGSTFEQVRRLVKSATSSHVTLTVKDCK